MMPGVEIDVRIELARHEVLVLERDLLELERQLEHRVVALAHLLEHPIAHLANDLGARVEVLVNPMTETHQPHAVGFVLDARQELIDVGRRADTVEHVEHGLVRTAVRGTPKRRHSR